MTVNPTSVDPESGLKRPSIQALSFLSAVRTCRPMADVDACASNWNYTDVIRFTWPNSCVGIASHLGCERR